MIAEDDDLNMDFNTSEVKSDSDLNMGRTDLPEGKYVAEVEKVEKEHNSKTPCFKFTFLVVAGPHKNRKVFEKLYLSEKANKRVVLFGSRLGLIADKELGQGSVRKSWAQAVGQRVVIDVKHRPYDANDGSKKIAVGLDFGGIYRLTDPAVADVVKDAGQTAGAGTGAADNQKAFDDL